jgi:hypothetical protein
MMEKPILFSSPMVKAILAGKKTQTRRIIKNYPSNYYKPTGEIGWGDEPMGSFHELHDGAHEAKYIRCPYNHPGDHLWVRETWQRVETSDGLGVVYRADESILAVEYDEINEFEKTNERLIEPRQELHDFIDEDMPWKPAIHMPRWASRITLEITNVRVERLHDISESEALAEGIENFPYQMPESINLVKDSMVIDRFARLWDSINAKRGFGWEVNPWVWVIEFKVVNHANQ